MNLHSHAPREYRIEDYDLVTLGIAAPLCAGLPGPAATRLVAA